MNSASTLRLFSLNVGKSDISALLAFLKKLKPDVICLQEIFEDDFVFLKKALKMKGLFAPNAKKAIIHKNVKTFVYIGVAFLTNLPIKKGIDRFCYAGHHIVLPEFIEGSTATSNYFLFHATVIKGNSEFVIGTTYFIWTPDGKPDDFQRKRLVSLLGFLEGIPEIIFCGDFNAPRDGEIFGKIASCYKDNIPKIYKTSLDPSHKGYKAWGKKMMVDGLFSTPRYNIRNVFLHNGLSDHCAITADIS